MLFLALLQDRLVVLPSAKTKDAERSGKIKIDNLINILIKHPFLINWKLLNLYNS